MYVCKSDSGFVLQYGPILAVLNTTKANKRIRIFHTRVKLRYLITEVALLSILAIQLLVVSLTFESLYTKILDFFNLWIFVRTSMNLAHLASFQAIEFVDRRVPKMLGSLVCQRSKNKAFCNLRKEREHDLIASPVFTLSAGSAWHYDCHNNVGRNESSSSENPLGN